MAQNSCELDLLHKIGGHVANGDTFDETLASTIEFAVGLVSCDECVAYVREGALLVPWVWKYSSDTSVEHSSFSIERGHAAALAEQRQPMAVCETAGEPSRVKHFSSWSTNPGETFVYIPLAARSKLLGAICLKHHQPHRYSQRELRLLSSVAHLLGTDIRISELEKQNSDLILELETRKLVERSKGILQRDLGLSEEQASLILRQQSREKRRPMKDMAQAIILSDELRRSALAD
jgi:transcriptional regulator with GAF, ATPase, and Fis domain